MYAFTQESLRIVKKAAEDNKLVIVVGAGVSMMSNFPSWKEVIDRFAGAFYEQKESYSQNDYLRIPQKYYNLRGHKEYYDLLREVFDRNFESNRIHDEILDLQPVHLITTNYDDLLEKAIYRKGMFYDVIATDEEVSMSRSKSFILKMHGDLGHQNVVLKENDYLSYSHHFKLIETMVKSIIASNITLFIGYSLNDRNMKLILNWIKELQGSSFQPAYLLYLGDPTEEDDELDKHNFDYYKSQGIHLIDYHYFKGSHPLQTFEERYLAFFEHLHQMHLDELYREEASNPQLRHRLTPIHSLNRIRLKDLRHLLPEYQIKETGILQLLDDHLLEVDLQLLLKKAGIVAIQSSEGKVLTIKKEAVNYLKAPYTTIYTDCLPVKKSGWESYQRAYSYFKRHQFEQAYQLYSTTASDAFKKKNYVLYFLSQFNRYWTGRTIQRVLPDDPLNEKITRDINHLNLEILYYHLPATFKRQYAFLVDLSNFYFIYKYLNDIVQLVNDHDEQGEACLEFKAQELFEFMHENLLVIDDYLEVSHLYQTYIEARLKTTAHDLESFTLLMMIKYMSAQEFENQINGLHLQRLKTSYLPDLIAYLKELLRLLNSSRTNSLLKEQLHNMTTTLLCILSYCQMSGNTLRELLELLLHVDETQITMSEKIGFIERQIQKSHHSIQSVKDIIEEALFKHYVKRHVLLETVDESYPTLARFLEGSTSPSKLEKIVPQFLNTALSKAHLIELVELSSLLSQATQSQIQSLVQERLQEQMQWDLLKGCVEQGVILDYHELEDRIQQALVQSKEHLRFIGQMIALDLLRQEPFLAFKGIDDIFDFLLNLNKIKRFPVEETWFIELPLPIHEKIAKTEARACIQQQLKSQIREGQYHPLTISLFFDIYG